MWATSVTDDQQSEFEQRLQECYRLVFRVALGVLRNPADAEEIAQDAFLRAYRKFSTLREPRKFRFWVSRMSFRLALNRRRGTGRALVRDASWMEMSSVASTSFENLVAHREFRARVDAEIERLPEKLRVVLLLSAVQELDARDIAEMLGIPEGTVRSRLHLARKELWKVFCHETL